MVRFKNRYITVEITPRGDDDRTLILKPTALRYSIQKKVEKMYGDFGLAAIKASFNAKYCNTHTGVALIKCRHGPHNFLIDSIPTINDVGGRFVSTRIIYVGATMKHCFSFIQECNWMRFFPHRTDDKFVSNLDFFLTKETSATEITGNVGRVKVRCGEEKYDWNFDDTQIGNEGVQMMEQFPKFIYGLEGKK